MSDRQFSNFSIYVGGAAVFLTIALLGLLDMKVLKSGRITVGFVIGTSAIGIAAVVIIVLRFVRLSV